MGRPIVIAKKTADTTQDIVLHSQLANRHGLIAGATGTGKTVTLKVLRRAFLELVYLYSSPMPKAMCPAWPKQVKAAPSLMNGLKVSISSPFLLQPHQWCFGIYLANRVIRFALPFLKLARCCWRKY